MHGHVAGFLPALKSHPEIQLVGIEDPDTALAKKYENQFHLDPKLFYTSIDAMIQQTHPQALLVYTAISDHRKVIEIAAAHGINVMVEKPLATTLEDALAIRKIARAHHIQVLVNYETTWYSSNRAAYDELQQGKLGVLHKVIFRDGHQGPKEIGVPPEFLSWLTDPQKNGAGALFDFGCYGADLVTWLMHGETPISVTAVAQTDKPNLYPHVDDDATIIVRYPKMQAVLMPSWDWSFSIKDMALYGTKGSAVTVGPDKLRVRYEGQDESTLTTPPPLAAPQDDSLHYLVAVLHGQFVPEGRSDRARYQHHRHADSKCRSRFRAHRSHNFIEAASGIKSQGVHNVPCTPCIPTKTSLNYRLGVSAGHHLNSRKLFDNRSIKCRDVIRLAAGC